jgi:CheY-like chemotaxis protein
VLSKPITPSALYNAVARILQQRHPGSLPPSNLPIELTGPQIPGVRVLVVDDNDINREVAQHILESEGGLVSLAKDGLEALEWLSIHANEVDIVLMDIQMPRMDGYTATREIRQNLNLAALPVVALTAGATKDLEDAAIAAGMDDFITKPFNVQSMITVIQRLTACKPVANYRTENVDVSESKSLENLRPKLNLAGIDVEAGLKIWRQIDVYQTYLSLFISQYQNAGKEIASSSEHGDNAAAAALTHKLKGAAYILALNTVAQRSIDVETALTTGTSVASATAALQTAIEEVSASLSTWLSEEAIFAATHSVVATLPGEIEKLLMQLLAALDEDSPGNAEQLLITIENLLGTEAIAPIKKQLQNFNFREAEVLSMTLMHKLNLPIK